MNAACVSVIIPTFNSAKFVIEALDSVAAQEYRPIQLVVVDDGSSDGTTELVESWLRRACAGQGIEGELIRQVHRGGGAARNRGIDHADGEWVQFLDSDDTLGPNKMAVQAARLSGTDRTLAFCAWRFLEYGESSFRAGELKQASPIDPEMDPLRMHLEGWYCPPHSYLWPRALLRSIGGWDPSLAADQDGDLLMRALAAGARLMFCPDIEVQYRMHSLGQVSRILSRSKVRSRLRVARKLATILENQGRLNAYRESIAIRCDNLERSICLTDRALAAACRSTALTVSPGHRRIVRGGRAYRLGRSVLGFYMSEWLSSGKRRVIDWWRVRQKRLGNSSLPGSKCSPRSPDGR